MKTIMWILFALFISVIQAVGVSILGGDPNANISAPVGDRGWSAHGQWMTNSTGIKVSTNWFLASTHVKGQVGDWFTNQGVGHQVISKHVVTNTFGGDVNYGLTLWKVGASFPTNTVIAEIVAVTNFVGLPVTVFGRGMPSTTNPVIRQTVTMVTNTYNDPFRIVGWDFGPTNHTLEIERGTNSGIHFTLEQTEALELGWTALPGTYLIGTNQAVTVSVPATGTQSCFYRVMCVTDMVSSTNFATIGWYLAEHDRVFRWGENVVRDGGPLEGNLWYSTFDPDDGAYECALSDGDSSGGAFTLVGGVWKLVALNLASQTLFSADEGASWFTATITDMAGLTPWGRGTPLPTDQGVFPSKSWYTPLTPQAVAEIKAVAGLP